MDVLYNEVTSLPAGTFPDTATVPSCAEFAPFIDRVSGRPESPAVGHVLNWVGAYLSGFDAAMYQRRVAGHTDDGLARVNSDDGDAEIVFRYCLDHPSARMDRAVDDMLFRFEVLAALDARSGNTALDAAGRAPPAYRPPSPATLGAALGIVADTAGRVGLPDRLDAYNVVMDYLSFGHPTDAVRTSITGRFFGSPFTAHVQRTLMALNEPAAPPVAPDSERYQGRLDRLNALPADEQQIVFNQISRVPGTQTRRFASLESYKANLKAHVLVAKAVERLQSKWGVNDLSQVKDDTTTRSLPFRGLRRLQLDPENDTDGWTLRAARLPT